MAPRGRILRSATPHALSSAQGYPDTIHDNFLYMERVGLLSIERDPDKRYPEEIARVNLTENSLRVYDELKIRPDPGDLF